MSAPPSTTHFRFWPFALGLVITLAAAGGLNWLVDPLWYQHGNLLGSRNLPFNERIQKTNLLKRSLDRHYDCLILGSSRVIGLHADRFSDHRCFNLAVKGAEAAEILAYGRFARDLGLRPAIVYVGVDDFNFLVNRQTERRSNPTIQTTPDFWHAYFTADALVFSAMTLANVSPDPYDYYDANFQLQQYRYSPWAPITRNQPHLDCDQTRVLQYRAIRELFPNAKVIGYAPLMSPWHQLSEVYLRNVLDCELDAFFQISSIYDGFLDFGIPNAVTLDSTNTRDGSHFTPMANDGVVDELEGRRSDLALDVKSMTSDAYRGAVRAKLHEFVVANNLQMFWHD